MGFGMATHLVKQGYSVTGFDVWQPTLDRFQAAGGLTASTPAAAVGNKDYCVCMVATAQQAQAVLLDGQDPALPALPKGATLLLCSTVPCAYVQSLAKQLVERGRGDILLIDAPVSGGATRAAEGTLSIMAGAPDAAIEKGQFLLRELSDEQKLYIVQGGIGAGSNMKMVHQVLAANQILGASEAMGFAARLGLDLPAASQAVLKSDGWAWMLEHRLPRMLTAPEFKPIASALTIILKDAGIITNEAMRYGFPTPMTSTAEQVFFAGLGRGYGPDDDSGMIRVYTEGKDHVGNVQGQTESDEEKLNLVVALQKGINLCSAAESLAFAKKCDLDLDQVLNLCINAAGGSTVLQTVGPEIVKLYRGQDLATDAEGLGAFGQQLQKAVEEAQRLKVPLYLGTQALNLIQLALQHALPGVEKVPSALVAKVWGR
ncbi:hypothetical protein SLS62_003102 [Diatrype stigma]|uniref:3-hydroxyisobutyrate dehydrogenase n=1 Tax=Diatrype stigma TaxID=117547 RepID=A0AAN9YQ31_9PEZI